MCSSCKLAADSYIDPNSTNPTTIKIISIFALFDSVFTGIFITECVFKVISIGFIWEETTYLRDGWNQLDFIIVVFSILELILSGSGLLFIKILRLMRVLRPLRFISRNYNMKTVVTALLESFRGIANVVVVITLCWVMIAILGINLVQEKMGYCNGDDLSMN